jgi:hypothetical protein
MSSNKPEISEAPSGNTNSLLLSVEMIQQARGRNAAAQSDSDSGGSSDGGGSGRSDGYTE